MSKESKTVVSEIRNLMVKFGFVKNDFAKLVDGTEVRVEGEELVEGATIYVVTSEGDVPAPDAVHELEDGTKVETVDGIIKSIVVEESAEEEVKEEVIEESYEEEIKEEIEEKLEEVEGEIKEEIKEKLEEAIEDKEEVEMEEETKEEVSEKIVEVIVPLLEKVKDLEEELTKIKASFKAFKNEPAGKAINKTKKEFSGQDTNSMVERILALKNSK